MAKKILILSASPKKDGNTSKLVEWFAEGAKFKEDHADILTTVFLRLEGVLMHPPRKSFSNC
ncbi:MAG: hypothetical protein WCX16_05345 [Candidatus Omnitrophota bacterium]